MYQISEMVIYSMPFYSLHFVRVKCLCEINIHAYSKTDFQLDLLLYCCCLIKYDILSITIKCVNGDFMYDNKVNYEYITFFCFILMAYARKSDRDLTWFNWNHMEGQLRLLQCSAKVFGPLKN